MTSSKAFLFGSGDRILIWVLLGVTAGCLAVLGLVSVNLVTLHAGGVPPLPTLQPPVAIIYAAAGIGLVAVAICAVGIGAAAGRAMTETDDAIRQRRDQQSILRLLEEIGVLATGDLTVHATVTEDVSGAIADSINHTIQALREMIGTINDTAEQVAVAADESLATAQELTGVSQSQTPRLRSSVAGLQNLLQTNRSMSDGARRVADVAEQSVAAVHSGAAAVREAADGMHAVRGQVQEASSQIRQLAARSQEIGDVVELVNDISEHTNTLALNASIQVTMAGESGSGFAVVADEVQRLAERAATASRQIESLVRGVQARTSDAVLAIEKATNRGVTGAQSADDAGTALVAIQDIAAQMSTLVREFTVHAEQQREQAQELSETVAGVGELTDQAEAGIQVSGEQSAELVALSRQLRTSMRGFTLPDRPQ